MRVLLAVIIGIIVGLPIGLGVTTFIYADGLSYFSGQPTSCINCHVMKGQYDSWMASSHKTVAGCNDCHSHGNIIEKYSQKALNGFLHSYAFTTGDYKDPIMIKNFNLKITKKACTSCHAQLIESSRFDHLNFEEKNCLSCHREVGHRKW